MDSPAEIFFRNMTPSPPLALLVREQVEKLEHLHSHIVSCRVTIALENHTHRSGTGPEVHIDIQVPGHSVIVNQKPEAETAVTIHKAFDAAAHQLKEYKARRMGHVKQHEGGAALPE